MKLATIAFAALSALIAAAPAYAGGAYNALTNNGIGINGVAYNATWANALTNNGVGYNAFTSNGVGYNAFTSNGVAERGSVGAKLVACTTGAEPGCELAPSFKVQSVTLGNGNKLDLR